MTLLLRSLLFDGLFYIWSFLIALLSLPLLLGPRSCMRRWSDLWAWGGVTLFRWVVGTRFQVKGLENLPQGACIVASKHQSVWETMVLRLLINDPIFVLKKELTQIPFFGWALTKVGSIPLSRNKGMADVKVLLAHSDKWKKLQKPIVIFPEGTRSVPGKPSSYHSGVSLIYNHLQVPVVPVALNSGLFWGRRSFLKKPGVITVEFLPPIEPGLAKKEFMARLESVIEDHSTALIGA